MDIGEQLKRLRKQAGFTQVALAEKANLSTPTIRLLEKSSGTLTSWWQALYTLNIAITGKNLPPGENMGRQLALLRKRRGLSQRTLAVMVHVTQPTLIRLERGGAGRVNVLNRVITALGAGVVLHRKGDGPAFYTNSGNSSGHHAWKTPTWLLQTLKSVFGIFDLDPCSPTANRRNSPLSPKVLYTEADDGLSLSWFGKVFVNPPYGRCLPLWTEKCCKEFESGNAKFIIALVPSRTDTNWWHRDIAPVAQIFFLKGRLRFDDVQQSAPFPSALVLWGATRSQLSKLQRALPTSWKIESAR